MDYNKFAPHIPENGIQIGDWYTIPDCGHLREIKTERRVEIIKRSIWRGARVDVYDNKPEALRVFRELAIRDIMQPLGSDGLTRQAAKCRNEHGGA